MAKFTHLHVHSHYSMLDGMSKVPDLIDKCMRTGMTSMALTDHGNMFGIKDLMDSSNSFNSKPKKKVGECEENIAKEKAIIDSEEKSEADKAKARERLAKYEEELPKLKEKAEKFVPFKPIIGIEAYCARRTLYDKDKDVKALSSDKGKEYIVDKSGWHLILLAKNKKGYQSLCKLASIAYTKGQYGRPRIDKNVLKQYHEGLIVCSACLGGEIAQLILNKQIDEAEKSILWFKEIFGDDYYLEMQRHKTDKPNADTNVYEKQLIVNKVLVELAAKTNTKIVATNDVHFVEEEHGEAHDRLICLSTGEDFDAPKRMRYTKQEWLKTPEEMAEIFADMPEVLENTQEIVDKVEVYSIDSGPIMPMFDIPKDFGTVEEYKQKITEQELFDEFTRNEKGEIVLSQEDAEKKIKKLGGYEKLYRVKLEADYLSKLTWDGARMRYGETLTDEQRDRIIFELHVMKTMGFPGYFLIVQDYIRGAREELGVAVGPGRGSAAGSVVAYCLHITDLDPLQYDLLFERFLNPDRISLPDIDVDFDDEGRGKVLDWVTKKYGEEKVAHIITYGTMATKSSIADVCRVQKIPLAKSNELKGYVPDKFPDDLVDENGKKVKVKLKNCYKYVPELKAAYEAGDEISSVLKYAQQLEDTNRQVGIHACGVIIGADDLTKFAPVCTIHDKASDEDVLVTQYDGHVVESVGLIKMDFLGLKTLSIVKEALSNIRKSKEKTVDIDHISITDELTYKLYSEGRTVGVFQFESGGMQKYLRELQPTVIGDLIAMNALYRPGPMDNIPSFIARKQGREEIKYDLPCMEKYLKDTYGITVYQEQVMLLSREIADFTRGESDTLRKAMGKKQIAKMEELFGKFMKQGIAKQCKLNPNLTEEQVTNILTHIWEEWKKFASYAFNKSHAACYAWVSYQTAYLKAHYTAEYMAALLTNSMGTPSDVAKFMDESRSLNIIVKGPDVNESLMSFSVNKEGNIRFGLSGIKGVGDAASNAIISERNNRGIYKSAFDFVERINLRAVNKKNIECLVMSGAFDSFGIERYRYFCEDSSGITFIETLIKYGTKCQQDSTASAPSLFGDDLAIEIPKPTIPDGTPWDQLKILNSEKELIGNYLSAHPLDEYELEMKYVFRSSLSKLDDLQSLQNELQMQSTKDREITFGGMLTSVNIKQSKSGKNFATITLEDFQNSYEFRLFGKVYEKYAPYLIKDERISLSGIVESQYNSNELGFTVNKIDFLRNLRPSLNSITLKLKINELNNGLINDIDNLTNETNNSQRLQLSFLVYNPENRDWIVLRSKSKTIPMTKKFFEYLDKENIDYKFN